MEYYSAIKKEWNLAICNNMDRTREYNTEWNKSVRGREIPYDFTHMWNLRQKKKQRRKEEREKQTKKQTLHYRQQIDGYQRGGQWRHGWNNKWRLKSNLTWWINK